MHLIKRINSNGSRNTYFRGEKGILDSRPRVRSFPLNCRHNNRISKIKCSPLQYLESSEHHVRTPISPSPSQRPKVAESQILTSRTKSMSFSTLFLCVSLGKIRLMVTRIYALCMYLPIILTRRSNIPWPYH